MLRDRAFQTLSATRPVIRSHQSTNNRGEGHALDRWRLIESRTDCRHGLATILPAMVVRRTPHRVTALHGLLRRIRTHAVECIRRESDGKCHEQASPNQPHYDRLSPFRKSTESNQPPARR